MSDNKITTCTYDDLIEAANADAPIEVTNEWLEINLDNLKRGAFYVAPVYFWAQEDRPLQFNIMKPGTDKQQVIFSKDMMVGRQLDKLGKDQWVAKRYKLDKSRHNGAAKIYVGWPANHPDKKAEVPFKIIAAPLTSKQLQRQTRIDAGLCPTCSKPGEWLAMAMVCKEHGIFLG